MGAMAEGVVEPWWRLLGSQRGARSRSEAPRGLLQSSSSGWGASEAEEATACSVGVDWQPAGTPLLSPTHTVFLEKAFSAWLGLGLGLGK